MKQSKEAQPVYVVPKPGTPKAVLVTLLILFVGFPLLVFTVDKLFSSGTPTPVATPSPSPEATHNLGITRTAYVALLQQQDPSITFKYDRTLDGVEFYEANNAKNQIQLDSTDGLLTGAGSSVDYDLAKDKPSFTWILETAHALDSSKDVQDWVTNTIKKGLDSMSLSTKSVDSFTDELDLRGKRYTLSVMKTDVPISAKRVDTQMSIDLSVQHSD